MLRMFRSLAMSVLVVLLTLTCSGCAAWHYRKENRRDQAGGSGNPTETPELFQSLQNASMNDWNFGRSGGIWF